MLAFKDSYKSGDITDNAATDNNISNIIITIKNPIFAAFIVSLSILEGLPTFLVAIYITSYLLLYKKC